MGLSEKLELIISADTKGAIAGLNSVGAAAGDVGKQSSKLDKAGVSMTRMGAAAVAGAAVAGAGLYSLASSASAYGEQVSRASKTFGDDAVPALEEFASAAAETAGISKTLGLQTANEFAALGKAAGLSGDDLVDFSTDMVQSAGDMASFVDIPVEEAITVIGSAMRGESEPIAKYGVDMKEAALQAEAVRIGLVSTEGPLSEQNKRLARNSILLEEGKAWAGDFVDTSDGLGNSQKRLAAEFDNVKVALGDGVLPFAEAGIGIVGGLAEKFSDLGPDAQGVIGKFAAMATVGVGLLGTMSFIGGQAIKMGDRFRPMGADGKRAFSKIGKGAVGASAAIGAAGVAYAIYEIGRAIESATEDTLGFSTALSDAAAAGAADDYDALAVSLGEAAESTEGLFDKVGDAITLNSGYKVSINDTVIELDALGQALGKAADEDPEGYRAWVAAFEDGKFAIEGMGPNTEEVANSLSKLDGIVAPHAKSLKSQATAAQASAEAESDLSAAMDDVGASTDDASGALDAYSDALTATLDPLFGAVDAIQGVHDAQIDTMESQAEINKLQSEGKQGTEEYAEAVRKLEDADRAQVDAAYDQEKAFINLKKAVADGGASVEDATTMLDAWVDSGAITVDQARSVTDEFGNVSAAADITGSKKPVVTVGIKPESFWSGAGEVDRKGFDGKGVAVGADAADWWSQSRTIDGWQFRKKQITISYNQADLNRFRAAGELHGGAAATSPNNSYIVGDQGPELFTPGPGGGSVTPNHMLGNYTAGGGGGGSVVNVNVTAGIATNPAETGRAVVDALRAYERSNGKHWRN